MNIFRTTIILLVVLTLSGCAPSATFQYSKPNTGQQQIEKDTYECRKEATYYSPRVNTTPNYGGAFSVANVDIEMAKACLRAKGYTITYK